MLIEKLDEHVRPDDSNPVRLKEMGEFFEVRYATKETKPHTRKLDADHYVVLSTGEVKAYKKTTTRDESIINAKQTLSRLRDSIRANVDEPRNCRWVTLTYAGNMRDEKQLYKDYCCYNQRFQRFLQREYNTTAEWVAIAEPQGRGVWHFHVLYIFPQRAPYISNYEFAKIWGHGFTKFQALKQSDDIAMYLSAHLTDLPLKEALKNGIKFPDINRKDLKSIEVKGKPKAFLKGARLMFYPTGMRIYRTSKGIKRPIVSHTTEKVAQEIVSYHNASLTFEKTIALKDSNSCEVAVIFNYRHYRVNHDLEVIENRIAL